MFRYIIIVKRNIRISEYLCFFYQSRAQQMQIGQPRPVFVIPPRRLEDDE